MQTQTQLQRQAITLKGSAQVVTQYFEYAVQRSVRWEAGRESGSVNAFGSPHKPAPVPSALYSILYQRGVYPSEDFKQKKEYGIMLWVSSDDSLSKYLSTVLEQVKGAQRSSLPTTKPDPALCMDAAAGHAEYSAKRPPAHSSCHSLA
jgi:mitotic spindle assembly checkpoint protein MAD2